MGQSLISRAMQAARLGTKDAGDAVRRRRAPFTPPRRMWPEGVEDFAAEGREQVNLMIGLGKLSPEARMVEIGCGSGLRARSLTDWLGPGGLYDGIDGDVRAVAWCEEAYRAADGLRVPPSRGARRPISVRGRDEGLRAVMGRAAAGDARARRTPAARVAPRPAARGHAVREHLPARRRGDRGDRARRDRVGFAGRTVRGAQAADGRHAQDEEWLLDRVAEAGSRRSASGTGRGPGAPTGARSTTSWSRGFDRRGGHAGRRGRARPRADRRAPSRPRPRHLLRRAGRHDRRSGSRVLIRDARRGAG